jgi:hypothetical protein
MDQSSADQPVLIGGISQLNARKPLSSFFTYNLLVYSDGLLFMQESLGEVVKTAGVMGGAAGGAAAAGGALGGVVGEGLAGKSTQAVFDNYTSAVGDGDRSALIADNKNHWYTKDLVTAVAIKKGWFTDKLTFTLKDGTILRCSSKRGYRQRDNILRLLPTAFPSSTTVS